MLAGATAGIAEHVAMFPVDTVKTRMQALGHPGQQLRGATGGLGQQLRSVPRALRGILRREGARGLYSGVGAVAAGAGPAHALYFASYEAAKEAFVKYGGEEGGEGESSQNSAAATATAAAAAGAVATLASDALMTPADVVKQRLQVAGSPYSGVFDCVRTVVATEGVGAFFRSLRTTVRVLKSLLFFPFIKIEEKTENSTEKTEKTQNHLSSARDERPLHRPPLRRLRDREEGPGSLAEAGQGERTRRRRRRRRRREAK